uniref:Alpha- and gamma-adaptin-binding protein p34 n=1 Tax=Phallusia mammillata TaxID=59560 RepID=A0A6F9D652_9ASCI|nr:alpha- and gamma-adaptin-binding protein p34 [Phallusia mammillata]
MMSGQIIGIVSSDSSSHSDLATPLTIVKGIIETGEITTLPIKTDTSSSYLTWEISNKYYSATVDICGIDSKNIFDKSFAEQLQAIVVIFNSTKNGNGLECLNSWQTYFDIWEPNIKLAVCERCSSDCSDEKYLPRESVQLWCIDNGFELVEINPDEDDFDEYEEFGTKRIRSALNAHTWPHMKLKTNCQDSHQKLLKSDPRSTVDPYTEVEKKIDSLLLDSKGEDLEEEDFEGLFQKMHDLKKTADSLPTESKKAYAEKVVMAFWKALDGDKDEVYGLSSDEDEQ